MAEGGNDLLSLGFDAATILVAFTAVKLSTDMAVTPVTAEGDMWIGINQWAVSAAEITAGKGASVRLAGTSLVKVGVGGVTRGTSVVCDAAGLAIATNTGGRPIGIAMVSGVAGDLVPVLLTPGLPVAA
jgi:hypothetical protein